MHTKSENREQFIISHKQQLSTTQRLQQKASQIILFKQQNIQVEKNNDVIDVKISLKEDIFQST